jgi:hypothetical protein
MLSEESNETRRDLAEEFLAWTESSDWVDHDQFVVSVAQSLKYRVDPSVPDPAFVRTDIPNQGHL